MKVFNTLAVVAAGFLCAVGSANAEDLVEMPNWSGPYAGINIGVATSSVLALPPYDTSKLDPFGGNSLIGDNVSEGMVVGYDHQMGPLVLGILGEANHTNIATSGHWLDEGDPQPWGTQLNWFGSARARVGVTSHDILFYGSGGVALADGKIVNWNYEGDGNRTFAFNSFGFVFGVGAEIMISPKWTASIDFSHYVFNETNDTQIFTDEHERAGELGGRNQLSMDVVKLGVNYRF